MTRPEEGDLHPMEETTEAVRQQDTLSQIARAVNAAHARPGAEATALSQADQRAYTAAAGRLREQAAKLEREGQATA